MLGAKYSNPGFSKDILYRKNYHHQEHGSSNSEAEESQGTNSEDEDEDEEDDGLCKFCDPSKVVVRKPREMKMKIHYGLIASGNQVIKDAKLRDQINERLKKRVLCFEMEAAGLMNDFPCIVIRGICDYADSHKNYIWQEYAAAVAAGFAKELLAQVSVADVEGTRTIKETMSGLEDKVTRVESKALS